MVKYTCLKIYNLNHFLSYYEILAVFPMFYSIFL